MSTIFVLRIYLFFHKPAYLDWTVQLYIGLNSGIDRIIIDIPDIGACKVNIPVILASKHIQTPYRPAAVTTIYAVAMAVRQKLHILNLTIVQRKRAYPSIAHERIYTTRFKNQPMKYLSP